MAAFALDTDKPVSSHTYWVITDQVGMPKELIDETGQLAWVGEQDIWGRPLKLAANQIHENTTDCSIQFQGQYFDSESRLHYNRFRYYSPGIAQYISPDPIGLAGSVGVSYL